jgi:hypothetical protein
MAEGGTNKERYERAKAATDELNARFQREGIPSPRDCYRMNTEEFAFNVTQKALIVALEALGLDRNLWLAILHETWLKEQTIVYDAMKKLQSDEMRRRLTDGIVIRPDIQT